MEKISVAFTSSDDYAPYCATTITSILKNSRKETELDFYVLSSDISNQSKEKLQGLKKIKDCSIKFLDINLENFKDCPLTHHYTLETYFKLKLPSLLPDLDKVIYMDCDMIVLEDLAHLFSINVDGFYAGMVPDWSSEMIPLNQNRLNLKLNKTYFNAGLMLINLKKCREDNIEEKLFDWEKKNKEKIFWAEQDIINAVFGDRIKEIPVEYNLQMNYYNNKKMMSALNKNARIIHYNGSLKPWSDEKPYLSNYFWKYAELNDFYDTVQERKTSSRPELQILDNEYFSGKASSAILLQKVSKISASWKQWKKNIFVSLNKMITLFVFKKPEKVMNKYLSKLILIYFANRNNKHTQKND